MKNIVILLFCFITVFSYSQNFTLRFKLNFGGDTLRYERVSHYFEPVSIITTDVGKTIDSLNRVRFEILDSLENDRMQRSFTLYYKKMDEYLSEFDPSDDLIKSNNLKLKDSSILEYDLSIRVLSKLLNFRGDKFNTNFTVNENINYDWIEDSKYFLIDYYNSPIMIFDSQEKQECDCIESITKSILDIKRLKRLILSKKTKNISISIFNTNKNEFLIYIKFDRKRKYIKELLVLS